MVEGVDGGVDKLIARRTLRDEVVAHEHGNVVVDRAAQLGELEAQLARVGAELHDLVVHIARGALQQKLTLQQVQNILDGGVAVHLRHEETLVRLVHADAVLLHGGDRLAGPREQHGRFLDDVALPVGVHRDNVHRSGHRHDRHTRVQRRTLRRAVARTGL